MGGFSAQVQQPQTSQPMQSGKGAAPTNPVGAPMATGLKMPATDMTQQDGGPPQPMGKGGNYQTSATSGQPRAGMPNNYSNTVGQSDNTQIQQPQNGGKGKG